MGSVTSRIGIFARAALFAVAAAIVPVATAQSLADTHVTGQLAGNDSDGSGATGTFDCKGEPTCIGTYQVTDFEPGCSNTFTTTGLITIAGLDLSQIGPVNISLTLGGIDHSHQMNADGTCTATSAGARDRTAQLSGGWDGTQGGASATVEDNDGHPLVIALAFTATRSPPPPVFPMTVTSNITPTVASASAQFQPRAQDVGRNASVFVFAHAPASLVAGTKRAGPVSRGPIRVQDGGDPCVLAQVDSTGKLVAASASSMTAAFTGVLSAQGQSVTLLDNVATPNVAGATMFTGYGSDASSMLSSGVYQGAVTIPGAASCATTLTTSAIADSPGALSGLWYNAAESGWGIYFAQRRNILFAAWYTYDATGKPKWYVSPSCAMPSGVTGTSGTCSGNLYEVSGPVFFGVPFNSALENPHLAGTLQVSFADANNASMTYTAAGQTRTVPIVRQVFGSATPPAVDFTDLWWNPNESGWGMAVSHRFDVMFLAWFVYDAGGSPVWYVAPSCTVSGNGCSGTLYRTTGPAFGPTFDASAVHAFEAGTVKLSFSGPNNATLTYTVDGVAATKLIQRQTF